MSAGLTYLITGATGAIGSAIVPLLAQEGHQVRLILRAKNPAHLQERLEQLHTFWELPLTKRQLIQAFRGNVDELNLGLNPDDYRLLTGECTHIIHASGLVKMNLPLEVARKSSLDSVRNLITFAKKCSRFEKMEFISTVGVGGKSAGLVPETWIEKPPGFHNSYEQAKSEAEKYIRQEIEAGLPITVHRPSMVVGDSKTGKIIHFQIFYHLIEFLKGKKTFGFMPNFGEVKLDIIPSDYVAQAIVWSSKQHQTIGKILHLCSGPDEAIPIVKLQEIIRSYFMKKGQHFPTLRQLPISFFEKGIPILANIMPTPQKKALLNLPIFLAYLHEQQIFDNNKTKAIIQDFQLQIPKIEEYLQNLLKFYDQQLERK